jgi:O-6-methylguanine DNA methyltransferase
MVLRLLIRITLFSLYFSSVSSFGVARRVRFSSQNRLFSSPFEIMEALLKNHPTEIKPFDTKVYEFCIQIPKGKVTTYKELAKAIGHPTAYRAVGSSLKKNPFAPTVPCHRVVASDLTLGGFFGSKDPAGCQLKRKVSLLKSEGVQFDGELKEVLNDVNEKELTSTKKVKIAHDSIFSFA